MIVLHSPYTLHIVSPSRIMRRRLSRVMAARRGHLSLCSSATADALPHTPSASSLVQRHVRANDDGGSFAYFWDFACRVSRKSRKCDCTPCRLKSAAMENPQVSSSSAAPLNRSLQVMSTVGKIPAECCSEFHAVVNVISHRRDACLLSQHHLSQHHNSMSK